MRTLFREFVVAKRRSEQEHDERMVQAWTIAALSRQKKLPDLKTLLARRHSGPQTVGQMKAMFYEISARYNLPLRKGKGKRRG